MSKNVLGSKYVKKISFGSASAAKPGLYMCNFKLKRGNYFSSTCPFTYNFRHYTI